MIRSVSRPSNPAGASGCPRNGGTSRQAANAAAASSALMLAIVAYRIGPGAKVADQFTRFARKDAGATAPSTVAQTTTAPVKPVRQRRRRGNRWSNRPGEYRCGSQRTAAKTRPAAQARIVIACAIQVMNRPLVWAKVWLAVLSQDWVTIAPAGSDGALPRVLICAPMNDFGSAAEICRGVRPTQCNSEGVRSRVCTRPACRVEEA